MARYIDGEKMLKYLEENNTADEWIVGLYNADWIYSFIESQPTADVVEVKHGYWKEYYSATKFHYDCSCCDGGFTTEERCKTLPNYCSNCGAKMNGGKAE